MNWVLYLFGSGDVFFLGAVLLFASLAAFIASRRRWSQLAASLLAIVGCLFIALSATPLPYWLYLVAGVTTALWLAAERATAGLLFARRKLLRWAVAVIWGGAVAIELPYQFTAVAPAGGHAPLYIVGDSVAAGMSHREQGTWPRLLARELEVVDLSRVGATAASALRQANHLPPEGGVVLLEIGGNDLLGSTSSAKFAEDLDHLLSRVCAPGRPVLMFELPLPPFRNEYGRAQRRLAARHDVRLIPKRVFISVLTADGATLDGVHLSPSGHELMADVVLRLLRP
jgi:acyl-CoA thioesterase-1